MRRAKSIQREPHRQHGHSLPVPSFSTHQAHLMEDEMKRGKKATASYTCSPKSSCMRALRTFVLARAGDRVWRCGLLV